MTPISCGDMSSEMYLDIEVYLSEYLQSGQVYHGVCLYGTTVGYGAGADTNISICNSYSAKTGLDVTDRDEREAAKQTSRSVTTGNKFPILLLQIETQGPSPTSISICNILGPKTPLTVTDQDIQNPSEGLSRSVTSATQIIG